MSEARSPTTNITPGVVGRPAGRIVGGRRFVVSFLVANAGMYAVFQGMQQIVLPSQISAINPEWKVTAYGALASVGALAAAVGNPFFGALSDRTKSRFGRRAPWLLGSGLLATALLALLGAMSTLPGLACAYVAVMVTMSAFQSILGATLPDRVPRARRGVVSAGAGASLALGVIYGLQVAPVLLETPTLAYLLIAALLVAGALLVAVATPDPTAHQGASIAGAPGPHGHFLSSFRDHDFAWAFFSRATFMVGHWTVATFQLFTLTDYIGEANLPGGNAAGAVALLGTIKLAAAFTSALAAGPISDRTGRRKPFVVVAALGVAGALLIPIAYPTWTGMIVWATVGGLFYGVYTSLDHALITLVLPNDLHAARDLGLMNIATTGPQIAAPFFAAVIIAVTDSYAALFAVSSVLAASSAVLVVPVRRVR